MSLRTADCIDETGSMPTPARSPGRSHAQLHNLDRDLQAASSQQRRRAARSRDLTALLQNRPDLVDVHAPADLVADAVRWCI